MADAATIECVLVDSSPASGAACTLARDGDAWRARVDGVELALEPFPAYGVALGVAVGGPPLPWLLPWPLVLFAIHSPACIVRWHDDAPAALTVDDWEALLRAWPHPPFLPPLVAPPRSSAEIAALEEIMRAERLRCIAKSKGGSRRRRGSGGRSEASLSDLASAFDDSAAATDDAPSEADDTSFFDLDEALEDGVRSDTGELSEGDAPVSDDEVARSDDDGAADDDVDEDDEDGDEDGADDML